MTFVKGNKIREGKIPWNKGKKLDRAKYPSMGHFQKHTKISKNKMSIAKKDKHYSPKTEFRKGQIPWNKDKKLPQYSRENSHSWKGGEINRLGYVSVLQPNHPFCDRQGYVKRSRITVEKHLCRYLLPNEVVHHRNEIKDDDRVENLIVFISNSAHIRFHHNPNNVKPEEIIFDGRKH